MSEFSSKSRMRQHAFRRLLTWSPTLALLLPYVSSAQPDSDNDAEVFELSPFEVSVSENDVGYRATNSLAGTRLNSSLKDIASSVSVITLAQLRDTASTDINDIFLYEANTEGTHNYTAFEMNRYGMTEDRVQEAPQSANRMRGIGSVDTARDYFVGISSIPFDSYNVERITIQRGPNSVLYGLGSPSGLVNSSSARASVNDDSGRVELRFGSYDDLRAAVNLNKVLIEEKLAIRVAALRADKGIRQQPAYDETDRQYAAITYKPFANTTLRANYERYINEAQRAGAITPADLITPWKAAGSPMWNPTTLTVTYDDGASRTITNTDRFGNWIRKEENLANYPGIAPEEFVNSPITRVENGVILDRIQGQLGTTGHLNLASGRLDNYWTGVTRSNQAERIFMSDGPFERKLAYPGFITPGVNDLSVYDYEHVNLSAANYYEREADIYQLNLEQKLAENLYLELAFHREDFDGLSENGLSSRQSKLYIDVNTHDLDGSVNENAGKPYMETVQEPTVDLQKERLDIYRATLAYELDFREIEKSWLGRHSIMALFQGSKRDSQSQRFSPVVYTRNDHWWDRETSDGSYKDFFSSTNPQKLHNTRYYMGNNSGVITHGSGASIQQGYYPAWGDIVGPVMPSAPLRHFLWEGRDGDASYPITEGAPVGTWIEEQADYVFASHDNGTTRRQQELESFALAAQSFFWDGRIVTTLGWRSDSQDSRIGSNTDEDGFLLTDIPPRFTAAYGYSIDDPIYGARNPAAKLNQFPLPWSNASGETTTTGIVVHPFEGRRDMPTWLQGMSLHYNRSDSFEPAALEVNLYGETLPDPEGTGEDFGISFSLLEDKLHAKVNFYNATAKNARHGGDTTVMTWRVARQEWESNWGFVDFWEWNIEVRDGLELGSLDFFDVNNQATEPYIQELYELSQLPNPTALRGASFDVGFNDVRNIESEGMEFTLDYNPLPNFNIKFNATKQESVTTGAAPNTARWAEERYAIWKTANNYSDVALAHGFGDNPPVDWWSGRNPNNGELADDDPTFPFDEDEPGAEDIRWQGRPAGPEVTNWIANGLAFLKEMDGKPSPQTAKWRANLLATYRFNEGRMRGFTFGGSVRWEDKKAVGFAGEVVDGEITTDPNRPFWDPEDTSLDFWTSYSRMIMDEKVRLKVQLNVRDAFEDGGLRVVRYNPDGRPSSFRIENPTSYYLTTSLDF